MRPKPAKSKEAKSPVARKSPKGDGARGRDLEKRLAEALRDKAEALGQLQTRDRDLTEALDQQTATAEVLRIIGTSPSDLQPVLDSVVKSAARFCGADSATLFKLDGDTLGVVAHHGAIPVHIGLVTPCGRGTVVGRTVLDRQTVHVTDLQAEAAEFPEGSANAKRFGHRTTLSVALLREGTAIGAIQLRRPEADRFTDKQVALLQIFADQAVIAIENVRLFNETKEALEQQTATAEILSVISGSPTDIQPVFDAVLDRALTLCEASHGSLYRLEDGQLRHVAARGKFLVGFAVGEVIPLASIPGRVVLEKRTLHHEDTMQELDWQAPEVQAGVQGTDIRTVVAVPLLREQTAIGAIIIRRLEVRPFSQKQIRLLQTFADQAVIAIENVRLFKELQTSNRDLTTALDKQTATSDILAVISRSQTDVQPVFDAIVASAVRLLGAYSGTLTRITGEQIALAAITSTNDVGDAALRARFPQPLSSAGPHARAIRDRAPLNIADAHTDPRLPEAMRATARARGFRSWVVVPMLRHDEAIGTISLTRGEPGGFTDDEIELLQTFADQAVIAIENVRLFNELQTSNQELTTSLDKQTATSDILRVISQSPTDVQPVFDAIVQSAVRLCGAIYGNVYKVNGGEIHLVAHHNLMPEQLAQWQQQYPRPVSGSGAVPRAIRTGTVGLTADWEADSEWGVPSAGVQAAQRARGVRSILIVPMFQRQEIIGAIGLTHREVAAFTNAHVELLQTLADQAVIAIENVRLFTELQEKNRELTTSLAQQTATAEILRVISNSPTDEQPVFDAIVRSAQRLLVGHNAGL